MAKITDVLGLEVLDSRGNPTVEAILTLDTNVQAQAKVPSGASTGEYEAIELRDQDQSRYQGKGVLKAIQNINGPIRELLVGKNVFDQQDLDYLMIEKDGTENKKNFGANAILAVSLAIAKAGALEKKLPLFRYLSSNKTVSLPCPMMNIINGGAHADNLLDFQEFMIRPKGAPTFSEALRYGVEIFMELKKILKEKKYSISVGDAGGFAPKLSHNHEAYSTGDRTIRI
jgi:enolase